MKCKYCGSKLNEGTIGYISYLDDEERTRMQQLKLLKNENICTDCKRELFFASLITII